MCGGNCRNSNSTMDPPVDGTPFRPKEAQLWPSEEGMVTTMMKLQEQLDRLQVKMTEKGDDVASWTQKRTDEAAEALLKLETDQEFSIGCLRRELETIWGKESSNAKDAVKEAKKISDRIDSFPPLSAATWRDWWKRHLGDNNEIITQPRHF